MDGADTYFLISCARSGSTSLAQIFGEATNGCCLSEPAPSLDVEARHHWEGRLENPAQLIEQKLQPRVSRHLQKYQVYGEKNVTLGFFVPEMHRLLNCKFVFLQRDGRDVVRSLMDWHNKKFGSIYRECSDPGKLNAEARSAAGKLLVQRDTSDYSRPRPLPTSAYYAEWESLSREEMCAFYWATVNPLFLQHLESLPPASWVKLDYTRPKPEAICRTARFCGLQGLNEARVDELLGKKINSLKDRGVPDADTYPDWKNWDGGIRRKFTRMAGDAMKRLGYFRGARTDWKPADYGKFWKEHDGGHDWYQWMYEYRKPMHQAFYDWIAERDRAGDTVKSIADFGCGLGIGHCDQFADKRYIGLDISMKNNEWCRANRANPLHAYYCQDFIETPLAPQVDVAASSGTIDNSYDVEAFLEAMILSARKWIYLTCYRGWFPERKEHKYLWDPEHACFYNDIAPTRVREFLQQRGCTSIVIEPIRTGRTDVPRETRIIARVP